MILLRLATAALTSAALLFQACYAHSESRNPVTSITTINDITIQSSTKAIHSHSHFDLYFTIHDGKQRIRMTLDPNQDVLSDDAHVTLLDSSGNIRSVKRVDRSQHRVYRGSAYIQSPSDNEWVNVGWARITLLRDGDNPIFEGAFRLHGDHHHIHTAAAFRKVKHAADPNPSPPNDAAAASGEYMVVWRDSDVLEYYQPRDELKKRGEFGRVTCGSDDLSFNANFKRSDESFLRGVSTPSLFGRQSDMTPGNGGAGINLVDHIGSIAGCPTTRKIALIGVAADCTYRQGFDSDEATQENIVNQINSASALYEDTFNISLGLQNLTILPEDCPASAPDAAPWNVGCSDSTTITDRLSLFSEWRGRSQDTNAFWTLLTTCQTGAAVGLAWLGQVCQQGSRPNEGKPNEIISSANVVVRTKTEWQVIAHEVGHTFGAVHDCTSDTCRTGDDKEQKCCPLDASTCNAGGQFIMNPSTGSGIDSFSPCSIGNVCAAVVRTADTCLVNNRGVSSFTGSQCGNGIVETGEDCDCGGEGGCGNNSCCDAKTCKFTSGSVCDPANEDCCTDSCKFASSNTVCRASTGLCDPEEKCTGDSSLCPKDSHKDDGTDCGNDGAGLTCASGQCTSREQQCKAMVGGVDTSEVTTCDYTSTCVVACRWPSLPENQCRIMNSFFLDGTPCPGGGRCKSGICEGGSFGDEVAEFFSKNKKIVIPVAIVVGSLVVLALVWCLLGNVRRRIAAKKRQKMLKVPSTADVNRSPNWAAYGGSFAPNGSSRGLGGRPRDEGPGLMGTSPDLRQAPPGGPGGWGPPPSYPATSYQPPPPTRRPSMRYA
ncbi:related to putative venom metalloproteinase jararhagin precursor [Cephalotrichum gorgonifer]|uniref:Disintegrin and metalloproteinase domain-containing protein B n=1 Tax=Cephalotrichum gorgonifer TaxID=2041049 RepID=A0AAE8MZ60_9PEZI|nr:related to putative venom metalloproteinase jararhagin precursor [Cephalotrichum gorgonifer]